MFVFEGLGPALRFLREKRGMSQKHVAAEAGVTPPMLSAYENGRTNPEIETLDKILHHGLSANLNDLCRALDIVNDRIPIDGRLPYAEHRLPSSSTWLPGSESALGEPLAPSLEEGYAEIVRGLMRISRHVFETVARGGERE